jgi:branched-chain amino acid transport system substrate-binding protein
MFVMSYADGKETPVEEWKITETIPDAVLYRLKGSE